ncbi:MAG: biotin--[acetyl-CoA-carboxylase] ligase [Thermodesulfobacteria bacterium]|nr:biotin--[acetyl-CoA-carboxylase] ligase [Thermodesulfobacteriota bacterium]
MKGIKEGPESSSSFTSRLATRWLGRKIIFFRELSSTQDEIRKHVFTGPNGLVVWADRQTQGRGRFSRNWYSPRSAGLYFSLLLKEPLARPLPLYGLATAVGVAQALEEVIKIPFHLKWPNDILLRGRKVGGILLEAVSPALIVGIGLNVSFRREDFPPEIREKATSIFEETGLLVSRAKILRAVLKRLEDRYELLLEKGFSAIEKDWRKRDVALGGRVVLRRGDQMLTGFSLGPSPDGTLLLKTPQGLLKLHSGEILMWEIPGWEKHRAA